MGQAANLSIMTEKTKNKLELFIFYQKFSFVFFREPL